MSKKISKIEVIIAVNEFLKNFKTDELINCEIYNTEFTINKNNESDKNIIY